MTKCAIMQPTYLPWVGYFSLIQYVDYFIFLDDVQFSRQSWQSRNKVLINGVSGWLSVPVLRPNGLKTSINQVLVDDNQKWRENHIQKLSQSYGKHPFFNELGYIHDVMNDYSNLNLSKVNENIIIKISNYLNIQTIFFHSSSFDIKANRSEKLYLLCQEVKADTYVSPPGSKEYLDEDEFEALYPIGLEYFCHSQKPYAQRGAREFIEKLSIYDLLANYGRNSVDFL
ncbi:MAG: hypothetical protein K0R76_427 [Alphaproteobacteria bacterium]|jgi:hypothetical protein|nr:hypothetical protein [Alphaproteobacteria bacterium]